MAEERDDKPAVYEALRRDVIDLLMEYRAQGSFAQVCEVPGQARSFLLRYLADSIAAVLVAGCAKKDPCTCAAALADAEAIAISVIDCGPPTIH